MTTLLTRAWRTLFRAPTQRPPLFSWSNGALVAIAIVLQLCTMWGITTVKDMEGGDAAYYITDAHMILDIGRIRIMWSPMYIASLAGVLAVTNDVYAALIGTRVIALVIVAPLIMLVFRRFLSPALAVLLFAIFAFNPAYFDALFTVHLWGLILPMLALVIAAYAPPRWSIPAVAFVLAVQALVMRNEYALVLALFLVLLVFPARLVPMRAWSLTGLWGAVRRFWYLFAILGVLILVMMLASELGVFTQEFRDRTTLKHTLNVCQIYAYYLQQNGDPRVLDPWHGCGVTAAADLGAERPSLIGAFLFNPGAIMRMMAFNVSLVPNGFQILMSGGFFGGDSPDYWAQRTRVLAPVIAVVMALIAARGFWANRHVLRRGAGSLSHSAEQRGVVVFAMLTLSVLALMAFISLTQRPRPSYLFLLGILVLLAVGLGVQALSRRWMRVLAGLAIASLAAQLVVTQVTAPLFGPGYENVFTGVGQPVLEEYRELRQRISLLPPTPVHMEVTAPVAEWSLCHYLARTQDSCRATNAADLNIVVSPRP